MSSASEHRSVGATVGAIAALMVARPENAGEFITTLAVGAFAGMAGAKLPDTFEPADHPNHRGRLHSASFGALVAKVTVRRSPSASGEPFGQRLARGALSGLGVGYVSHLALDATTPKGIPLL